MFERLLGLVEQAHVLDRDRGLVRKGLEEAQLFSRERRDVEARRADRPHDLVAAEDGHGGDGMDAVLDIRRPFVLRVGEKIRVE